MLRRLFVLIRRRPVGVAVLLLGIACSILLTRGGPDRLAKAIGELPPEQQQLLYLRFVADLESSDIARVTGKPERTVRLLQLQALRGLLEILTTSPR